MRVDATGTTRTASVCAKRHLLRHITIVLKSSFLLKLVVYGVVIGVGHASTFEPVFFLAFPSTLGTQPIALFTSMILLIYVVVVDQ